MNNDDIMKNTAVLTAKAVAHYWETRAAQRRRQEEGGKADQGSRSAVTGGAQMDGFIDRRGLHHLVPCRRDQRRVRDAGEGS
ncbi:MAG: PaeR7I family type II restriction endonuclease, partial [Proteobacteria bacterium]|nr:PaeR7I family type II restriction endonuclease [Pseudomonadota bacterium]